MVVYPPNITGTEATPLTGAKIAATVGPLTEPPELIINPLTDESKNTIQ